MLNKKNKNDIPEMMKYHRTKDMLNLINYFPELSPVKNLVVIKDLEDLEKNHEFCKNLPYERNDTLITKLSMKSIETAGININLKGLLRKVKEVDEDGVIILFDLFCNPSERYDKYAGICVGVSLGNNIFIDAVGKGFDGREVSKGLALHESYLIPWFELRNCNINNFKKYRTYIISQKDYLISRNERIKFLKSIGLEEEIINTKIPQKYNEIPDFIWIDVIKNIIKKLENMEDELKSVGLTEFVISGNTEGKKFLPWQMFDKSRYLHR